MRNSPAQPSLTTEEGTATVATEIKFLNGERLIVDEDYDNVNQYAAGKPSIQVNTDGRLITVFTAGIMLMGEARESGLLVS